METIPPRQLPLQISPEEIEIINDIRRLNFGRVTVYVQNGVIVSKEVTTVTKNNKHKNGSNGGGSRYETFDRVKIEAMSVMVVAGAFNLIVSLNDLKGLF